MNFTSIFSQLLNSTATSYKHLFLQALVDRVARGQYLITLNDITVDMLVNAWYPNQYFKLSFGLQDQIGKIFDVSGFELSNAASIASSSFNKALRNEVIKTIDVGEIQRLTRYVQYRLLTPFFHQQLAGIKDGVKNGLIAKLAESEFDTIRPLYKIHDNGTIELHYDRVEYISENLAILKDYLKLNWAAYVQKNNPNVPAVLNKTESPVKRDSLSKQTDYWHEFLKLHPNERCIYTDNVLSNINISIDHFLPWSFVCHDRIWNLIPVNANTNSSKSNSLPSLDRYLSRFVEQQHKAISTHVTMGKSWQKYGDIFLQDLSLKSYQDLLDEQIFESKLSQTIQIQHSLAKQMGFKKSWQYRA